MFAAIRLRRKSGAALEGAAELRRGAVAAEIAHRVHRKSPLPQQFPCMRNANGLNLFENRMSDLLREPQVGQRARAAHHAHDIGSAASPAETAVMNVLRAAGGSLNVRWPEEKLRCLLEEKHAKGVC